MKVAVAADHAGYPLKGGVLEAVRLLGHEAIDLGTWSTAPVDYPDIARAVAVAVVSGAADRGVLLCGSGVGAAIAANKIRGVRAAICHDTYSAHQGVEHDDLNILTLGARVLGPALIPELLRAYLGATFSGEERHLRRLGKVAQLEDEAAGLTSPHPIHHPTTEPAMSHPLLVMQQLGQSPWHDNIRRDLLTSGALARMIADGEITGLTSNPTIFEQAIATSDAYDAALRALAAQGKGAEAIFDALAIEDIRNAADLFLPVYQRTGGGDGYVSIEVSPRLAHDTEGTLAEARRLWAAVARRNLMVKIPATLEGLGAIEASIADGINVNVTLIFSLERYAAVMAAYIAGLRSRAAAGREIGGIASVASFFVSRVDSAVDKLLEARLAAGAGNADALTAALGKAAIANAQLAYHDFQETFASAEFAALAVRGARRQRPLWASTSSKNARYPDIYYVEALVGPDSVDTMPPATIAAYRDHGRPEVRIDRGLEAARRTIAGLAELGIDFNGVLARLEVEGVASFAKSYESLLEVVGRRARA